MSSQPHLQIFTSGRPTHDEQLSFSFFSLLPKELRLNTWRHALQRQRILNLHIKSRTEQTVTQTAKITEFTTKRERYCAVVDGCQVLSKFLRVNRESREEALKFYRVHLPCRFTDAAAGEGKTNPGILHFNPEYDFLRINPDWPVKDTLLDFLYHLKTTYDPHHVSVLNLAVDLNGFGNDLRLLQSSDLDSKVRTASVETLTQLYEVFFVSTPRAGRQIVGLLSGLLTFETMFNRSFPIMAMPPTFERLHRDPRPITQDLRKVLTGTRDSRHMVQVWRQLLKKWRVFPPEIEYRFLLAFDPTVGGDQISDRRSAQRWLQKEDDIWTGVDSDESFFRKKNVKWPIGASSEKYRDEDLETAVRPAFGFWLFPLDALGPLHGEGFSEQAGVPHLVKPMLDMTAHWPELALLNLP